MRCWMMCGLVLSSLSLSGVLVASEPWPQLPAVGPAMTELLEQQQVAGVVTLVGSKSKLLHLQAQGLADIEQKKAMQPDTIFWIASMSKPVTGVALCLLIDEGKLSLDDPVSKHLPEFAELRDKAGKPVTVTVRQIMDHTSGLADLSGKDDGADVCLLADLIPRYVRLPVNFPPGSQWKYCQSGINTGARLVEVLSGQPFEEFLKERLFEPLGMRDSGFWLNEDQVARRVVAYERTKEGKLQLPEKPRPFHSRNGMPGYRCYPAGNGGLFSTAPDYFRFCQMLLNNGELDGRRYLSEKGVKLLHTLQTGDDIVTGFTPGNGWGVGVCIVKQPQGVTRFLKPGTYGHGGAFGTQAWIDPEQDRILILMVQRTNFENGDNSPVRDAFQKAVLSP